MDLKCCGFHRTMNRCDKESDGQSASTKGLFRLDDLFFPFFFHPFSSFLVSLLWLFFFVLFFFLPVLSYDLKREDGQGKIPCLCQKRRTSPVGLMEEGTSLMFDDLGFLFLFSSREVFGYGNQTFV